MKIISFLIECFNNSMIQLIEFFEKIFKKFIEKEIYNDFYMSGTKFNINVKSYIKIKRNFSFKDGFTYSVIIPNVIFIRKKIIECLLCALEHESIGMAKYEVVKQLLYKKDIRNFHY